MEIRQTSTNSLLETLKTFAIGDSTIFTRKDFALNDDQSYRAQIWRFKKMGFLPATWKFKLFNVPTGGVSITRMADVKPKDNG